ncbi:NAD(P)/FAD-dependent oxidoreductase [Bradyrhizobium erythrophlei]|uniref:Glycine/D-amino acid oxidase n=1 Tax=Bradyrhizobium erythrophlei TaxID=1437360 RepID=A0A1H5GVC5_9BRAD|nr:FAD-dependent oxidoreductase [Bradyrhizobium erythrophlei]SEE19666.1 Glycine/D-amino acid oxidase [Bradyrhizobium erythrophlei]
MRGGVSPWFVAATPPPHPTLSENLGCDALIVGAGITGSLVAERLTRQGLDVVIVDRERPGRGSTAASTAMLLWEIDRPLVELTAMYGFDRAARAYRASLDAVTGLISLVREHKLPGEIRKKRSLYLAAGSSVADLLDEHRLRRRAGLPGDFLDHGQLLESYRIARAGAIVSPGAADADPLQLAYGLLHLARARGARQFDAEAIAFDPAGEAVTVGFENGREIAARAVVLATGYVMPDIVRSTVQAVSSSWAIATTPQPQSIWKDGALIWENAKDYLYARTTPAGRIIIGGEDSDEIIAPDARDRLIPEKARRLVQRLAALWPFAATEIEYRWAGTFDTTSDGLPLIGPVPGAKRVYAAYGYGGNGITFSYLAAQLIGDLIAGSSSPLLDDFALDRDGGMAGH